MLRYTVGDTKPDFFFYLQRDGSALDLTSAERVDVKLKKPSGNTVSRSVSIVGDPTLGKVQGGWGVGDLNEAGESYLDVIVTWAGGQVEHNLSSVRVLIREETSD